MLDRFKRKESEQIQSHPEHIIPVNILEQIDNADNSTKAKEIFHEWLKTISRPSLLIVEDTDQFREHKYNETLWTAVYDEVWDRSWPIGKENYKDRIPDIVSNSIHEYKLPKLVEQVEGIQKKLDKILVLMKDEEFCITGEAALKL